MIRQRGFSLVELMVTLAIVVILITAVGPNIRTMMAKNQVIAKLNDLSGNLQLARTTAINQQFTTTVCPTSDFKTCLTNWQNPQMVFIDDNGNGSRDDSEQLLASTSIPDSHLIITGPNQPIYFHASGSTASPATLLICDQSKKAEFARAVTVSLQGRIRASQDSNNDGIYEDNSGNPLTCN